MYVVVSTIEKGDNKVQAVPTSFFKDDKYYYPKKNSKVKKAIRNQLTPDDENWYEITDFSIISDKFGKFIISL